MSSHHHRSTTNLKQQNKGHKAGRHATKNQLAKAAGGKVHAARRPSAGLVREGKQHRFNHAKQLRQKKKELLWLQQRIGTKDGPPKIVALVALGPDADLEGIKAKLSKDATAVVPSGIGSQSLLAFQQFKQRFTLYQCQRTLTDILDAAKVADILVFVLPLSRGPEYSVDDLGRVAITAIRAQGLPPAVGVLQGLTSGKQGAEFRKYGTRFFEQELGETVKTVDGENQTQLTRALTTVTPQDVHWRSVRSYLLANALEILPHHGQSDGSNVTLKVSGYLRGAALNVNQLVHVTDVGSFHLEEIRTADDPCSLKGKRKGQGGSGDMDVEADSSAEVLARANPEKEEDLQMEATVDPMAGEQTWPTEEELAEAEAEKNEMQKKRKKVKGMSDYQSAWLVWDDNIKNDEIEATEGDLTDSAMKDDDEEAMGMSDQEAEGEEIEEEEEEEDVEEEGSIAPEGEDMALENLATKKRMADEDLEFPDEVDVPEDGKARERFARYRGLKSFRTSPWDPKESLPQDYARIYQFRNFARSQKAVLEQISEVEGRFQQRLLESKQTDKVEKSKSRASSMASGVTPEMEDDADWIASGQYISLFIRNVPLAMAETLASRQQPLLVSSLHRHENRLSVVHFNLMKYAGFTEAVKSKDLLTFYYGFRRVDARPIFSQNNLNSDKNKFERFLQDGRWTVASIYGPVGYQPCYVHVFREKRLYDGTLDMQLVATGSLMGVDPDRITLKRILLTGAPVRVKNRRATVRHMFYNPEDVKWFQPVELHTKHGLTGHIKESLGTHGDFKCLFNKPIKQHDTVCLPLFKRVYPKFPEEAQQHDVTFTAVAVEKY